MTATEALAAALEQVGEESAFYGLTQHEFAAAILAALDGWTLVPPTAPDEGLFSEAEAPRSLVSRADEWIALTDPPEIAALNVRGFAVWLDLKRKTQPAEGRCLCGGPWPCPDQDAPNYRSEAYAPHGLAQPAAPAEGLSFCGADHPEHPGTTCRRKPGHGAEHATARYDVTWPVLRAALEADRCGWNTRRGDGPLGGPCALPPLHDGPHAPHAPDQTSVAQAQPAAPAEGLDVAERRRLAGALANWALSPGESFRTLLPYLGLAYAEAYREGWMVFTNAINERLTRAEDAPAEGPDTERLARALCRHSEYVWSNEPEWQREEWRGKARKLLRVLCDIDRELAALEANHE